MEWFYEREGKQNGPVSEAALKELFAHSEVSGENLVWRDGMADWASYASVFENELPTATVDCPTCGTLVDQSALIPAGSKEICPHCRDEYAQGMREGLSHPVRSQNGLGTGGATPVSELRGIARDALSGNWGGAVLVSFLYLVLQQIGAVLPVVGTVIQWVIIGPLTLGYVLYFSALSRGESPDVGMLFSGFSRFMQGLGIYFVTTVLSSLAAGAAALPGLILLMLAMSGGGVNPEGEPLFALGAFIAAVPAAIVMVYMYLRYAMAYFIANDHPEMGVLMSIRRSVAMMNGHKKKLFSLYFSFIGWFFVGMLALGIGVLWPITYMWAAVAAFYDDLGEAS